MFTSAWILLLLLAIISSVAAVDFAECKSLVERVLAKNRPEFVLVPNDKDANTFVTSRVEVSISWSHIDALLDKSCVRFYLLEYGPDADALRSGRTKRESVSSSAVVSPPIAIDDGGARYTAHLPDDCAVYYARVIVAFIEAEEGLDQDDSGMSRSQPRTFWPAAHRVRLDSFSDGIVLTWPPACAHATDGWRLSVCARADPDINDKGGEECHDVSLRGDAHIHLSPLRSCSIYSLDLHSKSRQPAKAKHEIDDAPALWSFHAVKTLPKPSFDISAGHRDLHLRILQPDCHSDAIVKHWRVTRCDHVPGNDARKKRALELDTSDSVAEYSSGDGDSLSNSDDDDYYYYYDRDDAASTASARCHHELVTAQNASVDDGSTLSVSLTDLSECTLYAVDMTPTDEAGRALQPGEQYGTIHSTLCGHGERDKLAKEGGGKSFWFDEDEQEPWNGSVDPSLTSIAADEDGTTVGLTYVLLLATGGLLAALFLLAALLARRQIAHRWRQHRMRAGRRGKLKVTVSSSPSTRVEERESRAGNNGAGSPVSPGGDTTSSKMALLAK